MGATLSLPIDRVHSKSNPTLSGELEPAMALLGCSLFLIIIIIFQSERFLMPCYQWNIPTCEFWEVFQWLEKMGTSEVHRLRWLHRVHRLQWLRRVHRLQWLIKLGASMAHLGKIIILRLGLLLDDTFPKGLYVASTL